MALEHEGIQPEILQELYFPEVQPVFKNSLFEHYCC